MLMGGRPGRVKIESVSLKGTYRFTAVPVTPHSAGFFMELDKMILKCVWKTQGPRISRTLLKKTGKRDLAHHMPKCYKATVTVIWRFL